MKVKLYKHQQDELEAIKDKNRCALYWDMGLGKTYGGSEKMAQLDAKVNLVICQKSKIEDWIEHFEKNYLAHYLVYDLTNKKDFQEFIQSSSLVTSLILIGVINYELAFRRPGLLKLKDFTLMLDESSMIQNEKAKRSKFILKMKPKNVILLSGTPVSGKYEKLYSQLKLLGWNISKTLFMNTYCVMDYKYDRFGNRLLGANGFPVKVVVGYKNVDRLKRKLAEHGARFLKTEDVFDLPEQIFNTIHVPTTSAYEKFKKHSIVEIDEKEFVGDTTLTKMLYQRMLCGAYNKDKVNALRDLMESTGDRLIVFYNFNDELRVIEDLCLEMDRPLSIVNGKTRDLSVYDEYDDSVTAIQYQAGAKGLNLQKANKIIYFTPTLSCEDWMQSLKRVHRIGQSKTCNYYKLVCRNSIEEKVYATLERGVDYTLELFEKG